MCELSIIVPVYKAEKYIERTVRALQTQEGFDFEILLVNDGSPDKSGSICDRLSEVYNNVRCFHIANSGPGHARNVGLASAAGKYIAFCDSDDIPEDNMYGILLLELKKHHAQLALCDIYTERDQCNFGFPWKGNQHFIGDECLSKLLASMLGNLTDDDKSTPVWGSSVRSIYVRELLDKHHIQFPENIRFAEDLVFNVRYIVHCTSCFVLDKVLYHYKLNEESLMNSYIRYNPMMFVERKKLIASIVEIICQFSNSPELLLRFETSQRCYFHECIGNAARAISLYGYWYAYREIKTIISDAVVRSVFSQIEVTDRRKRIVYNMIQKRCNILLLIYYAIRLR